MTNEGMPVPHWVGEAREQMFDSHSKLNYDNAEVKPRQLPVVENFSNLFAEYEVRDGDLLVHVFPRGGEKDRYWPGEVKEDGTYIPSRLEHTIDIISPEFPNDIVNRIKEAADKVWQGDVAIDKATILRYEPNADVAEEDPVEWDMKAYAVQFQNAANTVTVVGVEKFVDQFCEALDALLE